MLSLYVFHDNAFYIDKKNCQNQLTKLLSIFDQSLQTGKLPDEDDWDWVG